MELQRISSNNEKVIIRIGDPLLADPAGKITASAHIRRSCGSYEDPLYNPKTESEHY